MKQIFEANYSLKDPQLQFKMLRDTYQLFLTFEHKTPFKELWAEQKKVYEEILFSADPLEACKQYYNNKIKARDIALARMEAQNGR